MRGIGSLGTPDDLLAKLEHDFSRLARDPADSYAAFDFFVTAEHMLDWVLPGYENGPARAALRGSNLLLRVVSHIANGSKHLVAQHPRHQHVEHVDGPPGAFQVDAFDAEAFQVGGPLVVTLEGEAAKEMGPSIRVEDLAQRVLEFWRAHPSVRSRPGSS